MKNSKLPLSVNAHPLDGARRKWLTLAGAGLIGGLWSNRVWSDEDDAEGDGSNAVVYDLAPTGPTARVVVVGGGMAGATVAKYLRLWGGAGVTVTLVDTEATYVSNIMSNLVLNGGRTMASLQQSRDLLSERYGVVLRQASVTGVDAAAKRVQLSDGGSLDYDRLVLAPGIAFDDAYGLTTSDYELRTPHAWRAGAQTQLLRDLLVAMPSGGTVLMTIPKAPYRCPPGPYERACLMADYVKVAKGAGARVVVLDHNASIQAEPENFAAAFNQVHAGVVDYRPGISGLQIDAASSTVRFTDAQGAAQVMHADVVNPIAPQRAAGSEAGGWLARAGLANSTDGRWALVNVLSYESTAAAGIHVIGDAAQCGLPKAGHVANQEAKICADAIVRLLGGAQPDPAPVANSACYSPITGSTASWLTAVYQYDSATRTMKVAANNGSTTGATPIEAGSVSSANFRQMNTWFTSLMGDTFA